MSENVYKGRSLKDMKKTCATGNAITPNKPVIFNADICNGCNSCVNICQVDVFIPNQEKGKPPVILYPDECWVCGNCVAECPRPGAIRINHPLMQKARWKRKDTGEHFRVT
jgi:NAD-dependent dihydropyrimidine dehydrogenase PreA subunit